MKNTLSTKIDLSCGFVSSDDMSSLATLEPMQLVDLRFHEGRMTTHAQYAENLISTLEGAGWTIRDASVHGWTEGWRL